MYRSHTVRSRRVQPDRYELEGFSLMEPSSCLGVRLLMRERVSRTNDWTMAMRKVRSWRCASCIEEPGLVASVVVSPSAMVNVCNIYSYRPDMHGVRLQGDEVCRNRAGIVDAWKFCALHALDYSLFWRKTASMTSWRRFSTLIGRRWTDTGKSDLSGGSEVSTSCKVSFDRGSCCWVCQCQCCGRIMSSVAARE